MDNCVPEFGQGARLVLQTKMKRVHGIPFAQGNQRKRNTKYNLYSIFEDESFTLVLFPQ